MEKLDHIIPQLLSTASKNREKFAVQLCFYAWQKAVGKPINQNTQPILLEKRKLIVKVKDSQWKKQLEAIKPKLKEQVNKILGEEFIKDICFTLKNR